MKISKSHYITYKGNIKRNPKAKYLICFQSTGNVYKKGKEKCIKAESYIDLIKKFAMVRVDSDNVNIKIKPIL